MQRLIQHWVIRQAGIRPDATAIVWKKQRMTYRELDEASNRLANQLREVGAVRGDRVCFCIPKSPEAIVAMVGILKADCVYVPVDVACPAARVRKVIDACEPVCILVSEQSSNLLNVVLADGCCSNATVGCQEEQHLVMSYFTTAFCAADLANTSAESCPSLNTSDDAAHILFTSGSTGTPKGVVITHANVTTYVDWTVHHFGMTEDDRVSGHAPLHFDLSTQDTYAAFAAGCELHLVPPELNLLPQKLAGFIRDSRLTQWFSVPSILNYLCRFDVVAQDDFPDLKRLLWCGEVLPTPTLIYFMQKLPEVQFTNLYGPTEATIASSFYTVPACPNSDSDQIPIGTPCDGEELLVLDDQQLPVLAGQTGDLYIAGTGLSPGYWRDQEKTDTVFLKDASGIMARRIYSTGDLARIGDDGLVYYIGRADTQIKSRGYRIELGEIETALHAVELLDDAAVVAIDSGGFENKAICCAWVPKSDHNATIAEIKQQLADLIPRYMIPQHWLTVDQLPRNANGKTDRPLLRKLFAAEFGPKTPDDSTTTVTESVRR
jgi:amino acid adenylation domain-containing protein